MLFTKRMWSSFNVALVVVAAATSGCLSDEEKEARRAWAYDLSGAYDEVRDADVAAGTIEIENENDDKNDVKVVFTRGALYDGEQAWLDRVADESERTALASELTIGDGDSPIAEELVGGENISDDFGESSTIGVSSDIYTATPQAEGATDAELYYTLRATIVNHSDELRGVLTVVYRDRRPDLDAEEEGQTELHSESQELDVLLRRVDGPIEGEVCEECTEGPADDEEQQEDPVDDDAA